MVSNANQHSGRRSVDQGVSAVIREPNKVGACTAYDFEAHNLTASGGLPPLATVLLASIGYLPAKFALLIVSRT